MESAKIGLNLTGTPTSNGVYFSKELDGYCENTLLKVLIFWSQQR